MESVQGHRTRTVARGVTTCCLERPVAVVQQDTDGVRTLVTYDQVRMAVPVEVSHRDEQGPGPHPIVDRRLEGPIAVAQ